MSTAKDVLKDVDIQEQKKPLVIWSSTGKGTFGIGVFEENGKKVLRGAVVNGRSETLDIQHIKDYGGLVDYHALAQMIKMLK